MIKVSHLKKTYYKGQHNEIKVINDTSLELPDHGLISFLGQSGSGKTTLLNVLGGLDKSDSGSIAYDNLSFDKYKMAKIDEFRSENIGYVFQNYLLIENLSIYDNLRLALNIIDINDEEEANKRIKHALNAVGLYKFRKKLASALSGGQQQRVSIARALVKNSKIIIADEPTGNLDSENSIEIMNILKKISKNSLVLLVTHSNELANFYSDRIIEIKDGIVIKDETNTSNGELNRDNDKDIHILDYNKEELSTSNVGVTLYSKGDVSNQNINIIIKDNIVYIDSKSPIQIVDNSNIKILNDHQKKITISDESSFNYDNSWFNNKKTKKNGNFFSSLLISIKSLFDTTRKRKIFNSIFVVLGIIMSILVIIKSNDTEGFTPYNENSYYFAYKGDKPDHSNDTPKKVEYLSGLRRGLIEDISSGTTVVEFTGLNNSIIKTYYPTECLDLPIDSLSNNKLIIGREPTSPKEVMITKRIANEIILNIKSLDRYDQLLGYTVQSSRTIVGICDSDARAIYSPSLRYSYRNYVMDSQSDIALYGYTVGYEIETGSAPLNELEIAVCRDIYDRLSLHIGDKYQSPIGDITLTGILKDNDDAMCNFAASDVRMLKYGVSPYMYYTNLGFYERSRSSKYNPNTANSNSYYDKYAPSVLPNTTCEYKIIDGRDIEGKDEVLVPHSSDYSVGDTIVSPSGKDFVVVGTFVAKSEHSSISALDNSVYYTNINDILLSTKDVATFFYYNELFEDYYISYDRKIIKFTDVKAGKALLESYGYNVVTYDTYRKGLYDNRENDISSATVIEIVLWSILIVFTFFTERAKIISEVYGIGVLRSLGTSKNRIYKKYTRENLVRITLTSIIGYLIIMIPYLYVGFKVNSLNGRPTFMINWLYILGGIGLLYLIQLFISLIPLFFLLRKTPSEINSKYDI